MPPTPALRLGRSRVGGGKEVNTPAPPRGDGKEERMAYEQMERGIAWFEAAEIYLWNFVVLDHGMVGHDRQRDASEIRRSCGWAWVKNCEGRDVYIRPARGLDWPIVFLDDLPPKKALSISQKYASMVVETSRQNCQVWIATTEPLDETARARVQGRLLTLVGADPGSKSGDNFGRAPGFKNHKPGRNKWIVRVIAASAGARLDASPYLTPAPAARSPAGPSSPQRGAGAFTGYSASRASESAAAGESEREYRYCLSRFGWALRTGRDPSGEVPYLVANLSDRAAMRGKAGHGTRDRCVQYAEITVQKALRYILQQQQSQSA